MPQRPAPPAPSREDPADVPSGGFAQAIPVLRTGYAGRGPVYLLVAGVSLRPIRHSGEAACSAS
ncbi:hypothetical protein KUW17_08520 [Leisingera aquaemixtae]|uniref:hypothetical protein n=1 Tax=Leisingera aquaemixtae TaxID=1396826 RepID=UPI001C93E69F|nr:hypothetical protein [Leisingera aquaemixtae]MBY6066781.1 hypothetical protein [Leisingera aquaemixtae]